MCRDRRQCALLQVVDDLLDRADIDRPFGGLDWGCAHAQCNARAQRPRRLLAYGYIEILRSGDH